MKSCEVEALTLFFCLTCSPHARRTHCQHRPDHRCRLAPQDCEPGPHCGLCLRCEFAPAWRIPGGKEQTLTGSWHLPFPLNQTTTLTLSLYNCGVQGITAPEAVVGYALFYGGLVQYLGGLWEFAS